MKKFGKFGNANLLFSKDWSDTTFDLSKLGTRTWDDSTNTCKIFGSALVKVIYNDMGFPENP